MTGSLWTNIDALLWVWVVALVLFTFAAGWTVASWWIRRGSAHIRYESPGPPGILNVVEGTLIDWTVREERDPR